MDHQEANKKKYLGIIARPISNGEIILGTYLLSVPTFPPLITMVSNPYDMGNRTNLENIIAVKIAMMKKGGETVPKSDVPADRQLRDHEFVLYVDDNIDLNSSEATSEAARMDVECKIYNDALDRLEASIEEFVKATKLSSGPSDPSFYKSHVLRIFTEAWAKTK